MRDADDHRALAALAAEPEVAGLARDPGAVRLLWDVCQVPDFRNVMTEAHTRLLGQLFRRLRGPGGHLEDEWVAGQVAALDRVDGDLDQLLARIAHIRTWTYVSHRDRWTADPRYWQERTRAVEDRLSDALHQRLTEEFVDRRAAVVARYDPDSLEVEVAADGELFVQGLSAGQLQASDTSRTPASARRATSCGPRRTARSGRTSSSAWTASRAPKTPRPHVGSGGAGRLGGLPGGAPRRRRGAPGPPGGAAGLGAPGAAPEGAGAPPRGRLGERRPGPALLVAPRGRRGAARRPGPGRPLRPPRGARVRPPAGLAPAGGRALPEERRELARRGVRLGRHSLFLPDLLRAEVVPFRALLWRIHQGAEALAAPAASCPCPPIPGRPAAFLRACGYEPVGGRAVRVDALERFTAAVRRAADGDR